MEGLVVRYLVPSGTSLRLPVIGQGTWGFGDNPARHKQEVEALRRGFELGMTLVDTAELYGAGESERVVGDAIADCRDAIFLITKIWPSHAKPDAMRRALEGSLRRMRTDHVDACLLHWPTKSQPVSRIAQGLRALQESGLTREVGVSNFPTAMAEQTLAALGMREGDRRGGVFFHELPYSLEERRVELTLLPQTQEAGGVLLAYSPLGHGRLLRHEGPGFDALRQVAGRHHITPAQAALAFLAAEDAVVVLAKASSAVHVTENAESGDVVLDGEDLGRLRAAFRRGPKDIGISLPPSQSFFSLAYGGISFMQSLRGRNRA